MSGVRPLKFTQIDAGVPAYIILVTSHRSRGSAVNPWDDLIDLPHGRIVYWGDAKFHPTKRVDEFPGNRALKMAYQQVVDNNRTLVPPILHFSKEISGYVRFNGLCVIDRLDLTWFEDGGRPVPNYRAHLSILSQADIEVDWLRQRAVARSVAELSGKGPAAWRRYEAGVIDRLRIWAQQIRSIDGQLPQVGSSDDAVLRALLSMNPTEFEAAVVTMFRELDDVRHDITRTRPTADGGFDFFGKFTMPPPLRHEIDFRGEVKRYSRGTPVTPLNVSRLVARLSRGQYGIFVTTSYFTRQAQEEVLADAYPTTLVAGGDLVGMMRELRIVSGSEIRQSWLRAVDEEYRQTPRRLLRVAEAPAPYE